MYSLSSPYRRQAAPNNSLIIRLGENFQIAASSGSSVSRSPSQPHPTIITTCSALQIVITSMQKGSVTGLLGCYSYCCIISRIIAYYCIPEGRAPA